MTDRILNVSSEQAAKALRDGGLPVLRRIDTAMAQGAVLLQREAVRNAPKAEGTLHRYVQQLRMAPQLSFIIRSISPHAAFVEQGTGLFGPQRSAGKHQLLPDRAISALALWIQRRGITPRSPDVTAEQLPWLIARKIARNGTRAQPYMEPAQKTQTPRIHELIAAAIDQGLQDAGLTGSAT